MLHVWVTTACDTLNLYCDAIVLSLVATLAVSDPGKTGHCLGKILVNCVYCFAQKLGCDIAAPARMSPARVTWQL